jgi:transcriptional antiterminator
MAILGGWFSLDVVSRRLELLKLEGLGFSQAEIVKELRQKIGCSGRTVYRDFESRMEWQPALQSVVEPQAVLLKVINRYEQIYRQASMRLLTSSNALAQLGALNIMLKANALLNETAVLPEVLCRLKDLEDKTKRGVFVP